MYNIFVDLEMRQVCQEYREKPKYCHNEVIQIGAVALDERLNEVGTFNSFVKPEHPLLVDDYSERLTGITLRMLKNEDRFETVLSAFADWCISFKKRYIVNSWSGADKGQILAELRSKNIPLDPKLQSILDRWNDFQKDFDKLTHAPHQTSLSDAVLISGLSFEGRAHDALCDARMTAEIFRVAKNTERFSDNVSE